jgi:general secretion pathway protein G
MQNRIHRSRSAFTLVEIMIVVAIIGLLAALAIPGFVKSRKQSQGHRIDARQMDAAIAQWAIEVAAYLKTTWNANDLLNNPYMIKPVGTNEVQFSSTTKTALANVGIDWDP